MPERVVGQGGPHRQAGDSHRGELDDPRPKRTDTRAAARVNVWPGGVGKVGYEREILSYALCPGARHYARRDASGSETGPSSYDCLVWPGWLRLRHRGSAPPTAGSSCANCKCKKGGCYCCCCNLSRFKTLFLLAKVWQAIGAMGLHREPLDPFTSFKLQHRGKAKRMRQAPQTGGACTPCQHRRNRCARSQSCKGLWPHTPSTWSRR